MDTIILNGFIESFIYDLENNNFCFCEWIKDIDLYLKEVKTKLKAKNIDNELIGEILNFYEDCGGENLTEEEINDLRVYYDSLD